MTNRRLLLPFCLLAGMLLLSLGACIDDEAPPAAPKPRGYFRIDMPEKRYERFDTTCPYSFERPWYSVMVPYEAQSPGDLPEPYWYNLEIPGFKATVHLSYKEVHNNLDTIIDNVWELTEKHSSVAQGVFDSTIKRPDAKVYGLVFELAGDAASQVQFYLTDSTKHFVRGALYFFAEPNKDSIAPVLTFLKKDIYHLIETFKWKDAPDVEHMRFMTPGKRRYEDEGTKNTDPADKAGH